jgi:cytochrome oxidase Cu insertion factor (SCO1/SenC/PrrC family)
MVMRDTVLGFCAGWFFCYAFAGQTSEDERLAAIQRLGELNGIALHCGAIEQSRSLKQALVANLPKQKQLGELFDYQTNRAFLQFVQEQRPCPAGADLQQQVEEGIRQLEAVYALGSLGSQFPAGPDLCFDLMRHNEAGIRRCLNAQPQKPLPTSPDRSASDDPVSRIGAGRFVLMDQFGGLMRPENLLGRYQLLYFGYTHCPDICPNTLQIVSLALDRLGEKAELIQPYFVTVDPERDSVKVLREYIDYFDPRFIGLTGSPAMIERMTAGYKVKYARVADLGNDPQLYLMDHSASLYLMAPDGRFLRKFVYGISAEQLARELVEILP